MVKSNVKYNQKVIEKGARRGQEPSKLLKNVKNARDFMSSSEEEEGDEKNEGEDGGEMKNEEK